MAYIHSFIIEAIFHLGKIMDPKKKVITEKVLM